MTMIITIDGPAASGKSTIAQQLAQRLQIWYLNSGLLYRGLAYQLVNHYRVPIESLHDLDNALINKAALQLHYEYDATVGRAQIQAIGVDITPFLKSAAMDRASSILAQNPYARYTLNALQRTLADDHSCIVEGRDAGSHTFTQAVLKIFITASLTVRAHRWLLQQQALGYPLGLEEARLALIERDKRDSEREHAPLQIPPGAFVLDTSDLTPEQGVEIIAHEVTQKIGDAAHMERKKK